MKHTITGFISYEKPYFKSEHGFSFYRCKGENVGEVTVMPLSIEFDVPDDFDPRPELIKALDEKQRAADAAYAALTTEINRQTTEINRQISELQALTMEAA